MERQHALGVVRSVIDERIGKMLDRCVAGPNGCVVWTGPVVGADKHRAYGYVKHTIVHRAVYEALRGPIPQGLVCDHLCRNTRCCNPNHIEPVTHRVNILRGTGCSARCATKTHCPKGHEYTPENTRTNGGKRYCKVCHRAHQRRRESTPEGKAKKAARAHARHVRKMAAAELRAIADELDSK